MQTIQVELGTKIVHVVGRVNLEDVLFEQRTDNPAIWETFVKASKDCKYEIHIQAFDEVGNRSYYDEVKEFYVPIFETGRTMEDIDRYKDFCRRGYKNLSYKEKLEWNEGMKGCLNYTDLVRIERIIDFIGNQQLLLNLDTYMSSVPEIPMDYYFDKMRSNLCRIRDAGIERNIISSSTEDVPGLPFNTFEKWNSIESILQDVYRNYLLKAS